MQVSIRGFRRADVPEVLRLFRATVHAINSLDYTPEQLAAWAPVYPDETAWMNRLAASFTFIAESGGEVVGFGNLERSGRIDCLYTDHRRQSQGIGTRLMSELESQARQLGVKRLTAEVSLTARRFFERRGFRVVAQQEVERGGVRLPNLRMEKVL